MPHSSRKKKPSPAHSHKRLQITDDSGWTHVTTSGNAPRLRRNQKNLPDDQQNPQEPFLLVPAEAPANITAQDLQRQLHGYRQQWEQSSTWKRVEGALSLGLHSPSPESPQKIEGIVCIGLGSPSGFLRGGWVDRRSVSMYQLAALVSIMGWMDKKHYQPQVYAQDPVFNDLDKHLLASLNISVLDHPLAFDKVSTRTLLFCPGAERKHLEQLLPHSPALLFGGPLEDIESEVVKQYVQARGSVQLPLFEEQEHAFWNMRVYYSPQNEKG